jgi:glycosyltransferase involved in cell wall biosynthesis
MKFSLIITNYNRSKFIDRAIRSCVNQIIFRTEYEIIVIDDASTDNSVDIIKEFSSSIELIENDTNRGVAYSSNIGLENAKGEYWMRVDSDDFLNEFACYCMTSILDENDDIDFVYCDHFRVDVYGVKVEKVRLLDNETLFEHGAGIMFRKKVLDEIGGYDSSLRNAEDYDLLVRILHAGYNGYHLPMPLYRYYIHGGNMTLSNEREKYVNKVKEKYDI